ncbi:nucleoside hydrolase [Corynebacterium mastitidis]|uniref:Nucleoside hydrolase n=1 Tax=Corynebacterium mastitidis TaxID=161890 RepID=A0A2N0X6K3_9CORY|nr:nucleoside hydrolase [Corynebacterium mastitidis]MCH6196327.1 nucleoside hydrolase [Corynebacterium mastitidis]PKF68310.1 nucleoside hydrolase [Corynebacterium mastitidis]
MIPQVILDCDTGIDDALALMYLAGLHRAGEIELCVVTCTAGNTTAGQAARNSRYVLRRCGIETVPVVAGEAAPLNVELVTTPETHGPTGLGYLRAPDGAEEAARNPGPTWREAWRRHPEAQVIVVGPATHLALWGPRSRVTLMGGAYLYPGNTTPTAEWNSWVDPHAAKRAFAQAVEPITVCSLGVTERFTLDPASLDAVVSALGSAEIARDLPELLRFYFEFHRAQGEGYLAQIHDLFTCMIALGRIPFTVREGRVDVEADSELLRGTTVADLRGHWGKKPNARLVQDADVAAAHRELLRAAALLEP